MKKIFDVKDEIAAPPPKHIEMSANDPVDGMLFFKNSTETPSPPSSAQSSSLSLTVIRSNQTFFTLPTISSLTSSSSSNQASINHTFWHCDANNSDQWLLEHPVCSTRYGSLAVFAFVAFVLTVITLWTIVGNIFVLVALYKYGPLRTMSNCLIGNLAISDLLLATTVLPVSIGNDLLGYWVFGETMCTIWLCIDCLYCTASVWCLCTVAFDRYLATVYPVWYHDQRSVQKAIAGVVFVWIFSAIISFAPFIGWRHMIPHFFSFNHDINRHECILFLSSSYVIYSSVGSFVIPSCLMIFMYIRIFGVLHEQSKKAKSKKKAAASTAAVAAAATGVTVLQVEDAENQIPPPMFELGDESVNRVIRDYTNTTLMSAAVLDSPVVSDCDELESKVETDNLLQVVAPDGNTTQIINGFGPTSDNNCGRQNSDGNYSESEKVNSSSQSGVDDVDHSGHSNNTTLSRHGTERQGSFRLSSGFNRWSNSDSSKRSNSLALPKDEESSSCLLSVSDFERRNSHNGRVHLSVSETRAANQLFMQPVCHRSKSANVLNSCSESDVSSFQPTKNKRRSLPCNISKFRRHGRLTTSMKRKLELREQRATKRMLLIMACFLACWMPFLVMYLTRSMCTECYMNTHFIVAIIWLGYINSALNPLLYTLFNDDFKMAFKKLVGLAPKNSKTRT